MALKQCKECGKDVGGKVKKCPHCGTDQRGFMGRHPILTMFGGIVLLGMAISIIAPKPPAGTATNNISNNSAPVKQTKVTNYKLGQRIDVGNFSYVVKSANFFKSVGDNFMKKTADGEYLVVTMDITNKDKEAHMIDSNLFKVLDTSNTEYSASTEGNTALQMSGKNTLFLKNCNPNITTSGIIAFEVPNKNNKYSINLTGGYLSFDIGKVALN